MMSRISDENRKKISNLRQRTKFSVDKSQVGERLLEHREKLGLTQENVAEIIDVSNKSVSSWELDSLPKAETLLKLAKIYNTTVEDLLLGTTNEPNLKQIIIQELEKLKLCIDEIINTLSK